MDPYPLPSTIGQFKKSKAKEVDSPLYRPRPPKRGLTVETGPLYSESPLSALTLDSHMTKSSKKTAPGVTSSPARATAASATWTSPRNKQPNDPKKKAGRGGSNPSQAGKKNKNTTSKGPQKKKARRSPQNRAEALALDGFRLRLGEGKDDEEEDDDDVIGRGNSGTATTSPGADEIGGKAKKQRAQATNTSSAGKSVGRKKNEDEEEDDRNSDDDDDSTASPNDMGESEDDEDDDDKEAEPPQLEDPTEVAAATAEEDDAEVNDDLLARYRDEKDLVEDAILTDFGGDKSKRTSVLW